MVVKVGPHGPRNVPLGILLVTQEGIPTGKATIDDRHLGMVEKLS